MDILYKLKKLDSENIILSVGENYKTDIYLRAINLDDNPKVNLEEIMQLLLQKKWLNENTRIDFQNKKFKLLGEIDTDFKIFIETDQKRNKNHEGGWILDTYNNCFFLELYSGRDNFKAIYKIGVINDHIIRATAISKDGNEIFLDWNNE